jgi:hypothetical protein
MAKIANAYLSRTRKASPRVDRLTTTSLQW